MKIKDIKSWFETAIPNPTIEHQIVQVGCHMEEFAEMLVSIGYERTEILKLVEIESKWFKDRVWKNKQEDMISLCDKNGLLDSLCDQIVTAVGVAHMLGMDIEGALAEVNASNHSKFEDGKAVFDDNGKITKGKDYRPPNLDGFIGG